MSTVPLLVLAGPTASGKTEASLAIAEALSAEIVCVDSTLVYRGMDVGTAKPTLEQRAGVPHHLLDLIEPGEEFSVARFQALAHEAIRDIGQKGSRPLLVGGGGLYFRAVVDGLQFPGTVPSIRRLLEAEANVLGPQGLYRRLAGVDPSAAARIEPGNLRRTVRALEVAAATGRTFSSFYRAWETYPPGAVWAAGVALPRAVLYRRIEERVAGMMPALLEETRALLDRGYRRYIDAIKPIGYAEAVACLHGSINEEEARERTVRRTKALARRQMAWLRRDPRIRWFQAGEEGAAGITDRLISYLGEGLGAEQEAPAAAAAPVRSAGRPSG